ncbi:hypothetical protein V5O48_005074 [Marasmius crinis-equi]|uniref:RNA-dependent RNA polymerase n=1 Tax=Marasmius crinis-equi TaxID=585013 RepID=A0ABR3FNC2_9AGAR
MQLHPDKNPGKKNIHERFARLGVVSTILRNSESRKRYDFFYKNGVPTWRGTGYYYSRFRPGLGTVTVFLVILTSGLQYLVQRMTYKRDLERIEHVTREARLAAWGTKMIPIEGQRKVKVNLGGPVRYDEDGYPVPGRMIDMVVSGDAVYILDPSGDMHPVDSSTAVPPAVSRTWFVSLARSAYRSVVQKTKKDEDVDAARVSETEFEEGYDSSATSDAPGSGTVTPNGTRQATVKAGGKRRKASSTKHVNKLKPSSVDASPGTRFNCYVSDANTPGLLKTAVTALDTLHSLDTPAVTVMPEIDRESSSGSIWDGFPSEDEQLFRELIERENAAAAEGLKGGTGADEENEEADHEGEYDALLAELSQAKFQGPCRSWSPGPEIDPEEDISVLIAEYDDMPGLVLTQPAELVLTPPKNNSEETIVGPSSSIGSGRKRSRDSSETTLLDEPRPKLVKTGTGRTTAPPDDTNLTLKEPCYAVAHSATWQPVFDELALPFGVQWEISRLMTVGRLSFDQIDRAKLEELGRLKTNARAAPLVEKILLDKEGKVAGVTAGEDLNGRPDPFEKERMSKFPYDELDLEEGYLNQGHKFGCLGFHEDNPWYGGKVAFRGKLKNAASRYAANPKFQIVLERPELAASYRFSSKSGVFRLASMRLTFAPGRYGSTSFLRLKIQREFWANDKSKNSKNVEALMEFLLQPLVLCGSVYRAVYEKEKTVFFFRTNELLPSLRRPPLLARRVMLSLERFIEEHNPIPAAKWAARFALGFSTSAPGLKLAEENILEIDDIISPERSEMTDGSGFINQFALRYLYHKFGWDEWPTAIQVRIAGAKGMLLQHPSDTEITPRVWIRPSQTKIKYESKSEDDARLIIDVLRSCHSRTHCTLGSETIINLAENGVSAKPMLRLLDESLERLVTPLTTWEGAGAMAELWSTVARLGGVMNARAARAQTGLARVKGYSSHDALLDEDEDGLDEDTEESSVPWWNDEISGQPSSLEETVMALLDAGFTPSNCSVLLDKLDKVITSHIRNFARNCRIEVSMSVTTFIQPDPLDVLEEGEVYFKSAQRNLLTRDGLVTDTVIGDVLVTRHPCKLPTDVQKWKAVDCPKLRDLTGIIFFSTRGSRRAADYLGGGDYDGDKALLVYDPLIVDEFKNADIKYADPRDDIEKEYFSKHTKKVAELLEEAKPTVEHPQARVQALQGFLLGGLANISLVSSYSNMHDYTLYTLGYSHPETIRMAHMFCRTLDGTKTGLIALQDKVSADKRKYDKGAMHWKPRKHGSSSEQTNVKRPRHLGPFIMDVIRDYADAKGKQAIREFQAKRQEHNKHAPDPHLTAPWEEARKTAERCDIQRMQDDLDKIEQHVIRMYEYHRNQVKQSFTGLPIEVRQNQLREMSRDFAASPPLSEVVFSEPELARLKASFAYLYDSRPNAHQKKWTRFPWDVAFRELCAIKARATGVSKTVQNEFYQKFSIKTQRNRR